MKDFVMWVMLFCLLVGGMGFMIARFIEKTIDMKDIVTGGNSDTSTVNYIMWGCAALLGLGLLLLFAVWPNL
jgi:hypothetical protein